MNIENFQSIPPEKYKFRRHNGIVKFQSVKNPEITREYLICTEKTMDNKRVLALYGKNGFNIPGTEIKEYFYGKWYSSFAFIDESGIAIWRRFREDGEAKLAKELLVQSESGDTARAIIISANICCRICNETEGSTVKTIGLCQTCAKEKTDKASDALQKHQKTQATIIEADQRKFEF